ASGQVRVSLRGVDAQAEIVVADTGVGIDAQLMPYIFERFRQGDSSSTRAHGGLGLGLALVKHLTELHGGTVEADSLGEGKGATFIVRLPLMVSSVRTAPERGEPAGTSVGPNARLAGLRVVVVDDDPDSLDMLSTLLRQQKAEVRMATSAAEALALVEDWLPHLVVADVEMPDEDGYSLVRRLRLLSPDRGGAALTVEIKSVNHRHLDVALRLPTALSSLDLDARRLVQARVERGRVEVTAQLGPAAGRAAQEVRVDAALARRYVEQARTLGRDLG